MLRSLLLALDESPAGAAACGLAFALARRTGAALTAAVVLDLATLDDPHEPVPPGGHAFRERRDAALRARIEAEAARNLAACEAEGHPFEVLRLPQAPEAALLRGGATHDLVVIGRDAALGLEQPEDGVAPVIRRLLMDGARPLLVVPPGAAATGTGPVLVGYDASLPAMAALQLFALLGLAEGGELRVVSVDESRERAAFLAGEGVAYLARHGIAATPMPIEGSHPAELLLAEAEGLGARLLVGGAYETTGLARLFSSSATDHLLRHARCPLFLHR